MRLIDADKIDYDKYHLGRGYTWDECEKVAEIIKEQPTVSQWIPTSERLPDKDGKYLCTWQGKTVETGMFINGHFRLYGEIKDKLVTAWQPLPSPYKEDT